MTSVSAPETGVPAVRSEKGGRSTTTFDSTSSIRWKKVPETRFPGWELEVAISPDDGMVFLRGGGPDPYQVQIISRRDWDRLVGFLDDEEAA